MYRYSYILHLQSYLEDVYAKLNAFDGIYNSSYRCDKGLPWIPREKMLLQRPVKERTVSHSTLKQGSHRHDFRTRLQHDCLVVVKQVAVVLRSCSVISVFLVVFPTRQLWKFQNCRNFWSLVVIVVFQTCHCICCRVPILLQYLLSCHSYFSHDAV